jgi:hypothetical protein
MTQTAILPPRHSVFHAQSWEEYDRTLRELQDECYDVNTPVPPAPQGSAPLNCRFGRGGGVAL